jgi:hypothetical protein
MLLYNAEERISFKEIFSNQLLAMSEVSYAAAKKPLDDDKQQTYLPDYELLGIAKIKKSRSAF